MKHLVAGAIVIGGIIGGVGYVWWRNHPQNVVQRRIEGPVATPAGTISPAGRFLRSEFSIGKPVPQIRREQKLTDVHYLGEAGEDIPSEDASLAPIAIYATEEPGSKNNVVKTYLVKDGRLSEITYYYVATDNPNMRHMEDKLVKVLGRPGSDSGTIKIWQVNTEDGRFKIVFKPSEGEEGGHGESWAGYELSVLVGL